MFKWIHWGFHTCLKCILISFTLDSSSPTAHCLFISLPFSHPRSIICASHIHKAVRPSTGTWLTNRGTSLKKTDSLHLQLLNHWKEGLLGNGSVSIVLFAQAWGLEFEPQHQLSIVNSSSWHTLIQLECSLEGFMQLTTAAVIYTYSGPVMSEDIIFFYSSLPLALRVFLSPLLWCSPRLGGRRHDDICALFMAEHSMDKLWVLLDILQVQELSLYSVYSETFYLLYFARVLGCVVCTSSALLIWLLFWHFKILYCRDWFWMLNSSYT